MERRKYPRIDEAFRIEYVIPESGANNSSTHDISAGGIAFASDVELPEGTVVKLHLMENLKNNQELIGLSLLAKVLRNDKKDDGYLIAAQFLHVPKITMDLMDIYLYNSGD